MNTLTANESTSMQLDMNEKNHNRTQCDILKEEEQARRSSTRRSIEEAQVGTESDTTYNDDSVNDCFSKDKYLLTIAAYFITDIFFSIS